jgi:hypothetical protein
MPLNKVEMKLEEEKGGPLRWLLMDVKARLQTPFITQLTVDAITL